MSTSVGEDTRRDADALRAGGGMYLAFHLGTEEYGIPILGVREIIGATETTPIPQTPDFMLGIINLRGTIVPIIDLRTRFGMPQADWTEKTCFVVVEAQCLELGLVVDDVSEVLDIPGDVIDPPPSLGGVVDTSLLLGLGKTDHGVKLLLDIDQVISTEDAARLAGLSEPPPEPALTED